MQSIFADFAGNERIVAVERQKRVEDDVHGVRQLFRKDLAWRLMSSAHVCVDENVFRLPSHVKEKKDGNEREEKESKEEKDNWEHYEAYVCVYTPKHKKHF